MFATIRKIAIAFLIISIGAFAFFGILSIWEVIEKQDVFKSLTSMGIISFASFLIILIAMEREGKLWHLTAKNGTQFSVGRVIAALGIVMFVLYLLFITSRFY
ncbi:MAG: hypothetical protein AAB604_01490 [Patescibacteria group bacterium]